MRGTVNMSPQGGAPTEPASKFNHSINTTGLPPKLNHTIDPSCFLQHGPHGPSDISAGHVAPTRLYWEQDSLASELSNKIKEWTLDMDAFVMERKLQGDTYALVAEKMKEKFGASVDLNLLQDRWETDIKKHLRDCIVNQALANATPHIIQIVQDEIKKIRTLSNNPPSEVMKEHGRLTSTLGDLKL